VEIRRKKPAHQQLRDRFNTLIIVFLTVCSKDRKALFAHPDSAAVICDAWRQAKSWSVVRYVAMPDHLHLFCTPSVFPTEPLMQWVRYWKSIASKNWPRRGEQPIWQRDFWDTQLRRSENYHSKWRYVVDNPVRAGLVRPADEWPFQGRIKLFALVIDDFCCHRVFSKALTAQRPPNSVS
jgi:putative transposase